MYEYMCGSGRKGMCVSERDSEIDKERMREWVSVRERMGESKRRSN